MDQLSSTGVPGQYDLVYSVHTVHARQAEAFVHDALRSYRYQEGKEFFEMPIRAAVQTIDSVVEQLPIRRSQSRSGRYNLRSKPLEQVLPLVFSDCKHCGRKNRYRLLWVADGPSCGLCQHPIEASS